MAHCRKCGRETLVLKRICQSCLSSWTDMRGLIFTTLQEKHGKLSPDNHPLFIKETKRLERIWKKDPDKFQEEINLINFKTN